MVIDELKQRRNQIACIYKLQWGFFLRGFFITRKRNHNRPKCGILRCKEFNFQLNEILLIVHSALHTHTYWETHTVNLNSIFNTTITLFFPMSSIIKCILYAAKQAQLYFHFSFKKEIKLKNDSFSCKPIKWLTIIRKKTSRNFDALRRL